MNPLAHVTVACGTVWLGARLIDRQRGAPGVNDLVASRAGPGSPSSDGNVAWLTLTDQIDYRLVMVGALLPDLVDKPLGKVLLRGPLDNNGHVFGHTLLFALMVLLAGVYLLARAGDPRVLAMAVAVFIHLAMDPVNHAPQTLIWPLLGLEFPHVTFLDRRATIVTEATAGLAMVVAVWWLNRQGRLYQFLCAGRL